MAEEFKRFDSKRRRKSRHTYVTLPDGEQIHCRRIDMTLMVMQGLVPLPLLDSVSRLISGGVDTAVELAIKLTDQEKLEMLDMMRRHASVVAIDPKITMKDTGKDEDIFVEDLTVEELTAIWTKTSFVRAPAVASSTEDFRENAAGPAAPDGQAGEDLQPEAEQLAGIEYIGS